MADGNNFNVRLGNNNYDYNPDKGVFTKRYLKLLGRVFLPAGMFAVAAGYAITEGINLFSDKSEENKRNFQRSNNNSKRR